MKRIMTFDIAEGVSVEALVSFDARPYVKPTRDDPGENAAVDITECNVRSVAVELPGIAEPLCLNESLCHDHYIALSKWILLQGDMMDSLEDEILEALRDEHAY